MPSAEHWQEEDRADGVLSVTLSSWKYFYDYVRLHFFDLPQFIWRGQRDADWPLESSLDRLLRAKAGPAKNSVAFRHLSRFKLASRGRRGPNPARISDDNEWWALAQHNGMATPLLDWTESPFVALYFAFENATSPMSGQRAVWALGNVDEMNKTVDKTATSSTRQPVIEYVRPMQDENSRLVSQSGLFTRVPLGETVDNWVRKNFRGKKSRRWLVKIAIPDSERHVCMKTLNRMNINHLSLFPDLFGAGKHCNNALDIGRY